MLWAKKNENLHSFGIFYFIIIEYTQQKQINNSFHMEMTQNKPNKWNAYEYAQ